MKKTITLLALSLLISIRLTAQLPDGSPAPAINQTDLNGNPWSLYDILSGGKQVVIIFMTAWSEPCWNYINSNATQDFYDAYGPNGTGQFEVVMIEADDFTTPEDLSNGTYFGDYTSLVNYPVIDDTQNLTDLYALTYFPTVFHVCTDGNLRLIDQLTAEQFNDVPLASCEPAGPINNPTLFNLTMSVTCENIIIYADLYNLGSQSMTSCSIAVGTNNGYQQTIEWTGNIESQSFETIELASFPAGEAFDFTAEITSADDYPDLPVVLNVYDQLPSTSHLQIELLTDDWPEETSWTIENSSGQQLAQSNPYFMAQTVYTEDLFLPELDCYLFTIYDAYGDGLGFDGSFEGHLFLRSVGADGTVTELAYLSGTEAFTTRSFQIQVGEIVPVAITGTVYLDSNEDGLLNFGEGGIGGIEVHLGDLITFTDANGHYIFNDAGESNSALSIVYDQSVYPTATSPVNYDLNSSVSSTFNFGLSTSDPNYNLNLSLSDPWFFCGFNGNVYVSAVNAGNQIVSGELSLTLDPLTTYLSAYPEPSVVNGQTVTWYLSEQTLGLVSYFQVHILNPGFEYMGQNLVTSAQLTTYNENGEIMDLDNSTINTTLACSYDPNDKNAAPTGETDAHYIPNGTDLEYLIRFQNTGNYQAFNIHILDELDEDLDINTFEIIATSHACQPTLNLESREIDFFFPDIMLPDSTSDEPGSHGFVRYRISPMANLPELTTIENTAYIYFDFNPAVVTNTYVHTVSDLYFGIEDLTQQNLQIYPNPANDHVQLNLSGFNRRVEVRISDNSGRILQSSQQIPAERIHIDCSRLAEGVYQLAVIPEGDHTPRTAKLIVAH